MIRALVLVALWIGTARAETVIELPRTTTTLTLDDKWAAVPAARPAKELVVTYKHAAGLVLAVTRADVPNPDAWLKEKKQAYADLVEAGIKSRIAGYKRLVKKLGEVNGVPALDVEAKRDDGAIVIVRVLLFRTFALSLAIEVPRAGDLGIARGVVKTFAPPKPAKD